MKNPFRKIQIGTLGSKENSSADFSPAQTSGIGTEELFSKLQEKETKKKKIVRFVMIAAVLLLAMITSMIVVERRNQNNVESESAPVAVEIPKDAENVFVNDVSGISPADEDGGQNEEGEFSEKKAEASFKSENYQIKDISFGGNAALSAGGDENLKLEVKDVRSEVLTSKGGTVPNVLIRWNTNKLARAEVEYDNGGTSKKFSEGGFGYAHALLLSSLDEGKRYTFSIEARDRWGNVADSGDFNIYTGKKPVSVFELIAGQFNEIFGWAMKK